MPIRNGDLSGSAPGRSAVALLIVDVINDMEFEGGEALLEFAVPMAEKILELKRKAEMAGISIVYVNDNFGKWRSDFNTLVKHCLNDGVRGQPVAELLKPDQHDFFVLKPRNSGFYSTTLEVLLTHLGTRVLVLTGMAGNNCILFTAADAYLRGYRIFVPPDCIASASPEDNQQAIVIMEKILKADTRPASEIDFQELV